jgi:hypothetical protein
MHKVIAKHYASPGLVSRCEPKQGAHEFIPRTGHTWIHPGPAEFDSCLVPKAVPALRGRPGVTSLREATWGWINIHPLGPCHLYRLVRIGVWFPFETPHRELTNRVPVSIIIVAVLQESMASTLSGRTASTAAPITWRDLLRDHPPRGRPLNRVRVNLGVAKSQAARLRRKTKDQ